MAPWPDDYCRFFSANLIPNVDCYINRLKAIFRPSGNRGMNELQLLSIYFTAITLRSQLNVKGIYYLTNITYWLQIKNFQLQYDFTIVSLF